MDHTAAPYASEPTSSPRRLGLRVPGGDRAAGSAPEQLRW